MEGIPSVPRDLLEFLEGLYPDQSPDLKTPEREIWFKAGQAALIRKLRAVYDQQNETILGDQ